MWCELPITTSPSSPNLGRCVDLLIFLRLGRGPFHAFTRSTVISPAW
jgi:hypothetical protein